MIYSKTNPVGVDKAIQLWQTSLYSRLPAQWGIANTTIRAFGRIEQVGDKLYGFAGDEQYVDALMDDKYAVQYFFIVRSRDYTTIWTAETDLYFFINLSTVSDLTTRADEEVRQDIFDMFRPSEAFSSVEEASDLPGYEDNMSVHPWAAFKIKLNLTYP